MDSNSISDVNMQIFETIVNLIQDTQFNDASCEFLSLHMDTFDEADENKLEYTTIFEEYVQILEKIIDSKLFETYQEDQVKNFYKDFALNFKSYEEINSDVVETLFGFTDFNRFKQQVLELKKNQDVKIDGSANPSINKIDESFFWQLYHEDMNDKSLGWQRKLNYKGNIDIEAFQRPQQNGGDIIAHTRIFYKGIKLSTLVTMFKDFDKFQPKSDGLLEQTIFERDDEGNPQKMYTRFKMPLMSERESLISLKLTKITEGEHVGKITWFMNSIEDPAYPITKDRIRISAFKGLLFWEEQEGSRAIEFSTFNMGGYFPMRLLNMAIGSVVRKTTEESYQKLLQIQKEAESTGSNTE